MFSVSPTVALVAAKGGSAEEKVSAIVEVVNSELLSSSDQSMDHLVEGQMDQNVTFEAAWRRGGFAEDDMENEGELARVLK